MEQYNSQNCRMCLQLQELGQRMTDSCNVNLPVQLVKIKFLIYLRISLGICSSELPLAGYEFIF